MSTAQVHANVQLMSSAPTFPSAMPPSHPRPHALVIDPHAPTPPSGSSILTPPPSAHPQLLSHQPTFFPSHGRERVSPGDGWIQHAHELGTRLQNPQHVSSNHPQQQQLLLQHQQQQQQRQLQRQQQQQQQTVTHPTTTMLVPATVQARPSPDQYQRRTSSSIQVTGRARLHGPQQAQPPMPGQAPPRGPQAQPAALAAPGAPGTHMRSRRAIQPHTQIAERPQTNKSPVPAPSSSSTQAQLQAQAQQQQQLQQERFATTPTIAAFKVLQPAKVLLEKTWSTAIAAVQQELAMVQSEHIRSTHEQQRLADLLQHSQAERAHALHALQEAKAQLRDCMLPVFVLLAEIPDVVLPRSCYRSDGTESTRTSGTKTCRYVGAGTWLLTARMR